VTEEQFIVDHGLRRQSAKPGVEGLIVEELAILVAPDAGDDRRLLKQMVRLAWLEWARERVAEVDEAVDALLVGISQNGSEGERVAVYVSDDS